MAERINMFISNLDPDTVLAIRSIANRRGETLRETVSKALKQYVASDKRRVR